MNLLGLLRAMVVVAVMMVILLLGACHEGDLVFHWITPEAPTVVVEPDVVPGEEVGEVAPEPMPEPPCELIKGNISRDGRKLWHGPGMPNYDQVKIDEAAGEMFFCSVEEAEEAGWTKAGGR